MLTHFAEHAGVLAARIRHSGRLSTRRISSKARKTTAQPYRLLKPDHYDKGKRYPLVLLLHGYGERGTDNEKPIKTGSSGASLFLKDKVRERFPCFVLVPQAPGTWISEPDFQRQHGRFANDPRTRSC